MNTVAEVVLWGTSIGAISWDDALGYGAFEYDKAFLTSGIQVSPIMMPLSDTVYRFPQLDKTAFYGLPGLLSDLLPDKFGHALIDAWLATQGRRAASFNPVERLCYIGSRGMGAVEVKPSMGPSTDPSRALAVDQLVDLASTILSERQQFSTAFRGDQDSAGLQDIFRVGTSAGGARAKAIIAWNEKTNDVRSGQIEADTDYSYWLLKFDGVSNNRDKELNDPKGFGAIEYAYYLMATAAGIEMSQCRLFEEGGRQHFMTQRFDRVNHNGRYQKRHMQTLAALCHYDFNQAGAYSYEQAFATIRQLGLPMQSLEQQFRRMVFNIVARNQDDHVKNIAFLMDKRGQWSLSPAYDITYSYNPDGLWTNQHQMTLNGKRDGFVQQDFDDCAATIALARGRAKAIVEEIIDVVSAWKIFAGKAGVDMQWQNEISKHHRLSFMC
ncbi:type II toxin-antitoxin system HipA family toxin [Eionea flava]